MRERRRDARLPSLRSALRGRDSSRPLPRPGSYPIDGAARDVTTWRKYNVTGQPMKSKVYLETTVISYLTATSTRDIVQAAHQQITGEWWERRD